MTPDQNEANSKELRRRLSGIRDRRNDTMNAASQNQGWDGSVPQIWRAPSGHVWITSPHDSFCGAISLVLSPRLVIKVDGWDFSRVVAFTKLPDRTQPSLTTEERQVLEELGAEDLADLIDGDYEGSVAPLPILRPKARRVVAGIALGERLHPIWCLDALLAADELDGLPFLRTQLRWQMAPTLGAIQSASNLVADDDPLHATVETIESMLLGETGAGADPVEATDAFESDVGRGLQDAICELLVQRSTHVDDLNRRFGNVPPGVRPVPPFDMVDVDDVADAWIRTVDGQAEVTVTTLDDDTEVWASVVTMLGVHSSAQFRVPNGERSATIRLPIPDFDYWIELHSGPDGESPLRPDRACAYASRLCSMAIAPLQAASGLLRFGLFQSRGELQLKLLDAAEIFEEIADEPALAEIARRVAALIADDQLAADAVADAWPTSRVTQLLISAQPVISAALANDRLEPEDRLVLESLSASPSVSGNRQPSMTTFPDDVPIDWIVEEFGRSLPETPLPDRALARAMNSTEDTSHRVELDDEQLEATGISSIVIEFSEQTVTVTVTRDRSRAHYELRIIEAGEALPVERSENPVADVYAAEFHRAASTVRVELVLGTRT